MENFEKMLDEYAKLVVEIGINANKNRPVIISGPVECAEFIRKLVKYSYKRGADQVIIKWQDDFITKEYYENASENVLKTFEDFKVKELESYFERGVSRISVYAEDPELLKNVDPNRIEMATKSQSKAVKHLMKYTMNDIVSWCVVSVPTKAWAKKVYPKLEEDAAVDKLWKEIFKFVRISENENATENWKKHLETMTKHADFLNEKKLKTLHYESKNGTDFIIELPKNHIWLAASSKNSYGENFVPNIPTEEVFTSPDRLSANGKVVATLPLSYNGVLIDKMEFEFKNGKVVDFDAKIGKEALENLLNMDENSKFLGEVALVPYDSPISNSNTIFYNTLFDENAGCHLAFGKAYPTTLIGGGNLNDDELLERGLNDSLVHEDFIIGAKDLEITGTTENGKEIKIFEEGNFAF